MRRVEPVFINIYLIIVTLQSMAIKSYLFNVFWWRPRWPSGFGYYYYWIAIVVMTQGWLFVTLFLITDDELEQVVEVVKVWRHCNEKQISQGRNVDRWYRTNTIRLHCKILSVQERTWSKYLNTIELLAGKNVLIVYYVEIYDWKYFSSPR